MSVYMFISLSIYIESVLLLVGTITSSLIYSKATDVKGAREEIKKINKKNDVFKVLIICITILAGIYCIITAIFVMFSGTMMFITFGGLMYSEAGGDSTGYNNLLNTTGILLDNAVYVVGIYIMLITFLFFTRLICNFIEGMTIATKSE